MGFRLASAISGFAKRTSQNLDALQAKADDATKTAAKRFADEALLVRKTRMAEGVRFDRAARQAKAKYGNFLNDAQLEALLYGGPESIEKLDQTVKNAQMTHAFDVKQGTKVGDFDLGSFLNDEVFKMYEGQTLDTSKVRTISEIREDYLSNVAPMMMPNIDKIAGDIQGMTTTSMFKGIDKDYIKAGLQTGIGDLPQQYKGPDANLQYRVNISNVDPMATAGFLTAMSNIKKIESETGKNLAMTSNIEANTTLTFNQNLEQVIKNNFVEELEQEKINKIKSEIGYTESKTEEVNFNADILEEKLSLLDKYGEKEKNLGIALLKAQIAEKGKYSDLETLQATLINRKIQLRESIAVDEFPSADIQKEIDFLDNEIANIGNAIATVEGTSNESEVFSKSNEGARFKDLLANQLTLKNIDFTLGDIDATIQAKLDGQQPQYFEAFKKATIEFANLYQGTRGTKYAIAMNNLLNTAMIDYAQSNPDKLTRIKNYKTVKDANGNVKELSYELADGTETQGVDPLQINTYAPDDPRNQEGILALNALKQKIFSVSTTPPTPGQTYAGQTLTRDMFIGTHVYINDHYDDVEEKLLDSPIQKIAIWNGTGFTISN
jgi:hypothetical protein|tara:strand:- start:4511 stop:6334 length:1824 start_codon:yes stop_codon:yes gene_type:complete